MNHHDRAADALHLARIPNPGRVLLALEQAGLVVVDATLHAINEDDRVTAHEALAEVATSSLGPLGRLMRRSGAHQSIRERYQGTQAEAWFDQIEHAKRVNGAA